MYHTLYISWGLLSNDMILYFHEVNKIAFGSSHKTLKLWEVHNFSLKKFVKSVNFFPMIEE